jgi:hypothetical protein
VNDWRSPTAKGAWRCISKRHLPGPFIDRRPGRFWDRIILTFRQSSDWPCSSWEEYRATADIRIQQIARKYVPSIPKPRPLPASEPEQWSPCKHYGGTRECDRCRKPVPELRRAQQMFDQHRRFVLDRLDKEFPQHFGGRPAREYSRFNDLEQEVWANVTARISTFTPNPGLSKDGALAWLTAVVHTTIADHLKHLTRKKRDVRKERPLREANAATFADEHNSTWAFAEPVRPGGSGPDEK